MEYDDLVEYYRQKLMARYRECISRPEWEATIERLRCADEDTRQKVTELLNDKKEGAYMLPTMTMTDTATATGADAPNEEFIRFLRFCADRLNKDEPVQAIWSAWKASTEKK